MAITLTHPDITRARTSDTARGPVNLTHPGRLTYANLPGQWHIGHPTGLLTVTAITCDCGADGPCEHIDAVRLHAGQIAAALEPVRQQQQMQQQDREAPSAAATLTHTAAADRLGIRPATVRRYLQTGKLTAHGDGVTAASVDAYTTRRAANISRTRGQLRTGSDGQRIAAAAKAQKRAAALEAEAKRLRDQARRTFASYGPGTRHGWTLTLTDGRTLTDMDAVRADYETRGEQLPTKTGNGSWHAVRAA